jgi:archaemetzincin
MLVLYSKVCIEYLTMKPIIIIQPILFQLTGDLTSLLEQHISIEFDALVKITSPLNDNQLPLNLFDKNRRQWKSDNILLWLRDRNKPDRGNKLLAICDFAYSNGLNFVFGQAQIDGRVLAIYLPRLRQEFYGLNPDKSLFYQRIIKEAVHELGHAFGLKHCNNLMCVMHFSNSLPDTDIKQNSFCDICSTQI